MQLSIKEQIKTKHPQLFPEKDYIDFSPPPGWYDIIHKVADLFAEILTRYPSCGLQFAQVKEKFGGLRIYVDSIDDESAFNEVDAIIRAAEFDANRTCENCGHEGEDVTTEGPGWIVTLCAECRKPKTETLTP